MALPMMMCKMIVPMCRDKAPVAMLVNFVCTLIRNKSYMYIYK